jgi:hypothetical protein
MRRLAESGAQFVEHGAGGLDQTLVGGNALVEFLRRDPTEVHRGCGTLEPGFATALPGIGDERWPIGVGVARVEE